MYDSGIVKSKHFIINLLIFFSTLLSASMNVSDSVNEHTSIEPKFMDIFPYKVILF